MTPPPLLSHDRLARYPHVFRHLTGLSVSDFAQLTTDFLPAYAEAERARLSRPSRCRAIGGGRTFRLAPRDQLLLGVCWLRRYPTDETLGFLFGLERTSVGDARARIVPVLAALGLDTMRLPDPGTKRRLNLPALLADTPDLAVLVDTFEQRVQRPQGRGEADRYYSGKKKAHTLKVQVGVDERDGRIVEVSASVRGPMADITLLRQSGMLQRLPQGVGIIGDLAYVGMTKGMLMVPGAWPRRKPRSQPRPEGDVQYNRAFAQRRVGVEHWIGRMRHFAAVREVDRHHRRGHEERTQAVAGLVNRTNWRLRG